MEPRPQADTLDATSQRLLIDKRWEQMKQISSQTYHQSLQFFFPRKELPNIENFGYNHVKKKNPACILTYLILGILDL